MKIAVSGKGGVGKTTFSAFLIRTFNAMGHRILAIDADPDANLAAAVGIHNAESVVPISEMKTLVAERTGSKPGTVGGMFTLNPKVDDLPEALSAKFENILLMRLGGIPKGGGGCICPESTLLKALVTHVVIARNEVVIMDMEAGIEHLGRGTATAVDVLIVVVEPGQRSVETARHIQKLANELHLKRVLLVGNKIRTPQDEAFLKETLPDFTFLGFLPYSDTLGQADMKGQSPYDAADNSYRQRFVDIVHQLEAL